MTGAEILILTVADLSYSGGEPMIRILKHMLAKLDRPTKVEPVELLALVETAQRLQPHLIITGHRPLPELDVMRKFRASGNPTGADIVKRLKEDPGLSRIPVLMLEAIPNLEEVAAGCGADASLAMPIKPKEFVLAVKRLLSDND